MILPQSKQGLPSFFWEIRPFQVVLNFLINRLSLIFKRIAQYKKYSRQILNCTYIYEVTLKEFILAIEGLIVLVLVSSICEIDFCLDFWWCYCLLLYRQGRQGNMLVVKAMQVLYKETALMESIITHKTKIRVQINGMQSYESNEVPVKEKLAIWNNQPIYITELPKGSGTLNLQFFFYKNNEEVGKARCKAVYGRNGRDCLDIANRSFQIVGKFLFQTQWNLGQSQQAYNYSSNMLGKEKVKQSQQDYYNYPNLIDYSQPIPLKRQQTQPYSMIYQGQNPYLQKSVSTSQYRPPDLEKPYFKNFQIQNQNQKQKQKKKTKKGTGFLGMFGGCFGCYGTMRKHKKPFFVIEPLIVDSQDLPYAAPIEQEPFPIQYYSKRLELSHKSV